MWSDGGKSWSNTGKERDVPGRGRPTVILVNCVTAPVNAKPRITARRSVTRSAGGGQGKEARTTECTYQDEARVSGESSGSLKREWVYRYVDPTRSE